jgi:hypothetical protein
MGTSPQLASLTEGREVTKICKRCTKELPISAFSKKSSAPDGYQYQCKKCLQMDSRQPVASSELLAHLKDFPTHALGGFQEGKVCAHCERLGCQPALCFECGQMGFAELYKHLRLKHPESADDVYRDKHGYSRNTVLLSSRYREWRYKRNTAQPEPMMEQTNDAALKKKTDNKPHRGFANVARQAHG